MKTIYLYILIALSLVSCIKEESPIEPIVKTSYTETIALGSDYAEQIYYDLENSKIVSSNPFEAWDIALNSATGVNAIVLNTAKFMKIYPILDKKFDEVVLSDYKAISDDMWLYDAASGNMDSTAFGTWWSDDKTLSPKDIVYIIDRGKNAVGDKLGHWKLQITSADVISVSFKMQDLRGTEIFEATIIKDQTTNLSMYSFDSNKQVYLEPPKDSWDLLFTRHTELLFTSEGDGLWYGVTSLLLNQNSCSATFNTDSTYNLITIDSVDSYTFSNHRNAIGHDWKNYDLEAGVYIMRYRNTYIIKSRNGYYFKLRFISFTNDEGIKGYPQFEFEAL